MMAGVRLGNAHASTRALWALRVGRTIGLGVVALLLAGLYPEDPASRPPFYGDVAVMTPDMDIKTLSDLIGGKKTFLFYFLPSCPHCKDAAPTVAQLAKKYGDRLQFLGVSPGRGRLSDLKAFKAEYGLPFLLVQDSGSIFGRRNGLKGTPAYLLTDGSPTPPITHVSFTPDMATVLEIAIRQFLGEDALTVLDPNRYHGAQVCATCHREAYLSWSLTHHAASFYALVKAEADTKSDCLRCHVTGVSEPGGFETFATTSWMADVGCEACHGRAGGHTGSSAPSEPNTESSARRARILETCTGCHDTAHSIAFEPTRALSFVAHQRDRQVPRDLWTARRTRLFEGKEPPPMVPRVGEASAGADSCRPCHAEAFDGWKRSKHAAAMESLEKKGNTEDPACVRCHATSRQAGTGLDRPGPMPGVQCEACHGPGAAHVAAGGGKDNILVLKGKALECVLEPRCEACHDAENDPDFDAAQALRQVVRQHGRTD